MNHHESAMADFYDHEQEPTADRRRGREAPDWGGDELFTSTPRRRRFERAPRGDHGVDRPDHGRMRDITEHPLHHSMAIAAGRVASGSSERATAGPSRATVAPAPATDAGGRPTGAARRAIDAADQAPGAPDRDPDPGQVSTGVTSPSVGTPPSGRTPRSDATAPSGAEFTALAASRPPSPAGRRTVTITGHPDRLTVRRRPAPTLEQRFVGSNPERIAAYAFALGILLIVIAFLSTSA